MDWYDHLQFGDRIASAYRNLLAISEEHASSALREGGWSRKEILGHLIDSALNNHQRFVRACLDGSYEGPTYNQAAWVDIHGYRVLPWRDLVEHWRWQNQSLGEVIRRVPEARSSTLPAVWETMRRSRCDS
jgi:hypothetical protein